MLTHLHWDTLLEKSDGIPSCYKIIKIVDIDPGGFIQPCNNTVTRGHLMKLQQLQTNVDALNILLSHCHQAIEQITK